MDIELARTFLAIVKTQSFIRAAEQLNVSQTTVSARVRSLEEKLGRVLFVRNKSGASLTPAGEQFLRYAPTFVQLWERARHQVAVPSGHRAVLAIGGELILWHPWMLEWLHWMRRAAPEIAIRVQVDLPEFSWSKSPAACSISPSCMLRNTGQAFASNCCWKKNSFSSPQIPVRHAADQRTMFMLIGAPSLPAIMPWLSLRSAIPGSLSVD